MLTDKKCKAAEKRAKPWKLSDTGGLYLEIAVSGGKHWRCKYRFQGKEKRLSFGPYPLVTLAEARNKRDAAKRLLLDGIDPMAEKQEREKRDAKSRENTFAAVASEWMEMKRETWSASHFRKTNGTLQLHVIPQIGGRPIAQITAPELLNDCLRRIEKRDALDIAATTRQLCGQIFRYAIQTGRCDRDVSADCRGALKARRVNHFRTIEAKDLPQFLNALNRNEARLYESTRRAIHLSIHTFCRPIEIRHARWEHVDFDARLWKIPAAMMKMRRDHIVPLSRQMIELLKSQQRDQAQRPSVWVFPGQYRSSKPMSDATVTKAIALLGFGDKLVAHGFRALARTTIREILDYDSEIIEKQLAHEAKGPLRGAYDRTQFLEKRIRMMQDWSDFIDRAANANSAEQTNSR